MCQHYVAWDYLLVVFFMAKDLNEIENESYSQSDVALYVITAVMDGNCYELLSGSGNVENNSLFQKFSISEGLYFYLIFSLPSDQHILIGANEGLYTLNLNEIHESSLELVSFDYRQAQKMFKNLCFRFKYFCVIYSKSLFNLSFKIKSMLKSMCNVYHLYMKVYHILI